MKGPRSGNIRPKRSGGVAAYAACDPANGGAAPIATAPAAAPPTRAMNPRRLTEEVESDRGRRREGMRCRLSGALWERA
ncbi:hypothetical protein GCM10022251_21330 [Phytohabitans flavus]|uniref:Uncharacterized protein n=1 Tax=Phytohabitans flavus TaxID=1076124 RepID=A0A6F8XZU9_9ACTN|nr:hypothetical protein Pflav_057470 [Phytohabitans flavus]